MTLHDRDFTDGAAGSIARATLETLLADRYGTAQTATPDLPSSEVLAALLAHRSVRDYSDRPVSDDVLELLVASAQSAASSSNLQLWSVVAVRDAARRKLLSELAGGQRHIAQVPLFLVWIADHHRLATIARDRGVAAPAALDYLEMLLMAVVDAALAAQNAVVAAESLGLGTVYIGGLRNHPERVAAALKLPSRAFAVFGLCVGWPAATSAAEVKPRLPQSVVLHREIYGEATSPAPEIAGYDQVMGRFYEQSAVGVGRSWTAHSTDRVETVSAMRGRDRLGAALKALGFAHR